MAPATNPSSSVCPLPTVVARRTPTCAFACPDEPEATAKRVTCTFVVAGLAFARAHVRRHHPSTTRKKISAQIQPHRQADPQVSALQDR